MIKCQVCGFDNKDDAQFCLNCGSPITKEKLSEALDDVSEDATVMLDPDAMQRRMQEEFSAAEKEEQAAAAAAASPPPPPPPAQAAPPPPPAQSAPPPHAAQYPAQPPAPAAAPGERPQPQFLITLILCLVGLLGISGLHRFYTGKIGTGILMLVTFGACGIWTLVDIITIALDKFTDAEGRPLAR